MSDSAPAPLFVRGDEVCQRSHRGLIGVVVSDARPRAGRWWYDVNFSGLRSAFPESALDCAIRSADPTTLMVHGHWGGPETLARILTFTKFETPLRDVLYSFRSTRTRFEPYQFRPLIRFLESHVQRLLVADEVGLGKTIEAGYILRELKARHPATFRRVLIVCPASLLKKWQEEMARRFDERFEIKTASEFRGEVLSRNPDDADRTRFQYICSLQSLRGRRADPSGGNGGEGPGHRPAMLDEIEAACPTLDLVIVDEAHHLRNPGTLHHRLATILSDKADAMVLLTATPVQLGSANLFHLLRILDPQEFADEGAFGELLQANELVYDAQRLVRAGRFDEAHRTLLGLLENRRLRRLVSEPLCREVMSRLAADGTPDRRMIVEAEQGLLQLNMLAHILTRTRRRDVVENPPVRTPHVIKPEWSEAEGEFYRRVTEFLCERYTRDSGHNAAQFAVVSLQRQMASSIPALLARIRSEHADTAADNIEDDPDRADLGEQEAGETLEAETSLYADPSFHALVDECSRGLGADTKWQALAKTLDTIEAEEPGRKVVIFSFFKATLAYLGRQLASRGITSLTISGDVPSRPNDPAKDIRGQRIQQFHEDPKVRVLLSSEVGGEGLDFHTRCHILINYDLPWNPMRLEQRIGRLDRFGQASDRILIFNFAIPGTIEDRILRRLYERIGIFRRSLGDLEAILGEELQAIEREAMSSRLSWAEKEARNEERAMVLVKKIRLAEEVEEAARHFVGQDGYYDDQIKDIERLRRFVTAEDLEALLGEVFDRELQAPWRAAETGVYQIRWNRGLDEFLNRLLTREELLTIRFRGLEYGEVVRVTCRDDLAYQHGEMEYLSVHHPLVQAVHRHLREKQGEMHPVAAVALPEPPPELGLAAGSYFYAVYLLNQISELRGGRYLEPVFVPLGGQTIPEEPQSHQLMHSMTTGGQAWHGPPALDTEGAARLLSAAEAILIQRRDRRQSEQSRLNNITADRRLASLRSTYEAKIGKMQARLSQGEQSQSQERYLRMIRGSIRSLETERRSKEVEIERGRGLEISHALRACGVVHVD